MASEAGAVKLEAIATDTQNLRAKAGVNITVEKVETPTAAQAANYFMGSAQTGTTTMSRISTLIAVYKALNLLVTF